MKMIPKVRIPGAYRKTVVDPETGEEHLEWVKPAPKEMAMHFRNAGARAKFFKLHGETEGIPGDVVKNYMVQVPVYGGVASRLLHQLQQNAKYAAKLASAEWLAYKGALSHA